MSEVVLYLSENMRLYERAAPSEFRVRSFLGRVIVTNERFLFLSAGDSGLAAIVATKVLLGQALGQFVLGTTLTEHLDLCAVRNAGGFAAPLARISHCASTWRFPLVWYLSLRYETSEGIVSRALMHDGGGFRPPALVQIEQVVRSQAAWLTSGRGNDR